MPVYAVTGPQAIWDVARCSSSWPPARACGSYRRCSCLSAQEGPGMVSGEPFEGARRPVGKPGRIQASVSIVKPEQDVVTVVLAGRRRPTGPGRPWPG